MSIIYSPLESLKYNEGLHSKFRINNYKTEEPEIYLCVELSKIDNNHKDEFWDMSSDKYCTAMVNNFHTTLDKKGLKFTSKSVTPLKHGYRLDLDFTGEIMSDGVQWYQEIIVSLRWSIEIGRIYILL